MKKSGLSNQKPFEQNLNDFWEYFEYDQNDITKANQFFEQNTQALLPQMTQDIFQNMQIAAENLGVKVHPKFIKTNDEQVKNNYIIIQNFKIDYMSLKCLNLALKNSNIDFIKLSTNNLNQYECQALKQILIENKLKTVFFEWNEFNDDKDDFLTQLAQSQFIQTLILRDNQFSDENIKNFFNSLANNENSQFQCIEIDNNNVGQQSIQQISETLISNQSLEYLGLPQNKLNFVQPIFDALSLKLMNQQDIDDFKVREKEKETIIAKNAKQKNPQLREKVPNIEHIIKIEENQYMIKNKNLQCLNIAINQFDEQNLDSIQGFLQICQKNFKLILNYNRFERGVAEFLSSRFGQQIQI